LSPTRSKSHLQFFLSQQFDNQIKRHFEDACAVVSEWRFLIKFCRHLCSNMPSTIGTYNFFLNYYNMYWAKYCFYYMGLWELRIFIIFMQTHQTLCACVCLSVSECVKWRELKDVFTIHKIFYLFQKINPSSRLWWYDKKS